MKQKFKTLKSILKICAQLSVVNGLKFLLAYAIAAVLTTYEYFPALRLNLRGYYFQCRQGTSDWRHVIEEHEPEITNFLSRQKGETFVDVGAHIGRYAILCSKSFSKVYALEPVSNTFKVLKTNCIANKINNVVLVNAAALDKNATTKIFINEHNLGGSSIFNKTATSEKIRLVVLDSLAMGKIDVVKIDVEGAEILALEGAKDILRKQSPTLIVESFEPGKLVNYLKQFRYAMIKVLDDNNYCFVKKI